MITAVRFVVQARTEKAELVAASSQAEIGSTVKVA
jgi:hypothetical protein